jgi:hypothetical protein
MALQMVTVTGTLKHLDGRAQAGRVEFALPYTLVDPAGHTLWSDRAVAAELDGTGAFSVQLPATDSAGVSPTNWTYTVTIATDGSSDAPFQCLLPASPSSVHLDELVRVDVPPTVGVWVPVSALGNSVATLVGGKVPLSQLPASSGGGVEAVHANPDGTIVVDVTDPANPIVGVGTIATGKVSTLDTQLAAKADLVGGKVPQAQIPAVALTDFLGAVASQAAMLALTGQRGDWCTRTDLGTDWQLIADDPTQLANWREHVYPASPVQSVAGRTGAVTLTKADVGLSSVDNTADTAKPVSTAQATAIAAKYALPVGGIPQSDLAAAVQTLLGLASSALQVAPADPAAMAYDCHAANFDPAAEPQNSTINEQWFMRILVRAGRQINLVKTFVRVAGTAGAGGLNGFALYSDDFSTLLWNSVSDDTMWLAAGEISKAVTGTVVGMTNRTPTVDTWLHVGLSARGHTAAPSFPFGNFAGSSTLTDAGHFRCRYRASGYSAWPASINPNVDLAGVTGFMPAVLIG